MSVIDQAYMQQALAFAERGAGWVAPNPLVGCVLVRDGQVIGEGWHNEYGGPHAEVNALADAAVRGESVIGATAYVTLEPCTHTGKTGPCSAALYKAGVARVVVAASDPNPEAAGGAAALRAAGIEVLEGVCAEEAEYQNRVFFHWVRTGLPYVTVKVAVSQDGYITHAVGTETRITGEEANRFTHALRQHHDAILVGANTVRVDNPRLNVRYGNRPRNPLRVVLSTSGDLPADAHIFDDEQVLVFPGPRAEDAASVRFRDVLEELARRNVTSVLVEGGQRILDMVLSEHAADEWIILRSSVTFGDGLPFVRDLAAFTNTYTLSSTETLGKDRVEHYHCSNNG